MDKRDQEKILHFWFGVPWQKKEVSSKTMNNWFKKDLDFDEAIRSHFMEMWKRYQRINMAEIDANLCLASIILFDQFPRNMFRNKAEAFSTDHLALELAKHAVAQKYDRAFHPHQRCFVYLPLEHSEDIEDQKTCVALFRSALENADEKDRPTWENYLSYAIKHKEIIDKFGRFPHRNKALGRQNTSEEEKYLAKPGAGF